MPCCSIGKALSLAGKAVPPDQEPSYALWPDWQQLGGFVQCTCRRADFAPYFGTISLLNQSNLLASEPVDSSGNSQVSL